MAKEQEETKEEKKSTKAKKLAGVAIGRNVHYAQSGGETSLAFITRVHDAETGRVNLWIIRDDAVKATYYEDNVSYSEDGETGTWHFIEKQ